MKEDDIDIHEHCAVCIKTRCSDKFVETCPVIECPNACGATHHRCKQREHGELCRHVKAPCINSTNGCPLILPRWKHALHLKSCPASVIRCSCQWNRWPMYSVELRSRARLPLNNPYVKCSQLDVALAMRDQRMLLSALRVPNATKRILRNAITPRYPAVPFEKNLEILDVDPMMLASVGSLNNDDSDEEFAPWYFRRFPPGLERSMVHKLKKGNAVSKNRSHLGKDYDDHTRIRCKLCTPKVVRPDHGNEHSVNSAVYCTGFNNALFSLAEERENEASSVNDTQSGQYNSQLSNISCSNTIHSDRPDLYNCSEYNDSLYDNNVLCVCSHSNSKLDGMFQDDVQTCHFMPQCDTKLKSDCDHDNQGSNGESDILTDILLESDAIQGARKLLELTIPVKVNEILGVDLNVESISCFQAKPDLMYTFMCGQDFRRDEYDGHFRNVHSDIQPALNNWMEQRCPMASYGCTFTFQRFQPDFGDTKSVVTHSSLLECFGITTVENVTPTYVDEQSSEEHLLNSCVHPVVVEEHSLNSCVHPVVVEEHSLNSCVHPGVVEEHSMNSCMHPVVVEEHSLNSYVHPVVVEEHSLNSYVHPDVNNVPNRTHREATPEITMSQKFDSVVTIKARRYPCHPVEENPPTSSDHVGCLPYMIWSKTIGFLDAFSLNNLSLVSKGMRDICAAHLESRGLVVERWRRMEKINDRARHWEVCDKKWKFSTSFTPVHRWKFVSCGALSEHLKVCAYNNDRTVHAASIKLPHLTEKKLTYTGYRLP